jgi:thiol-disulfide isomerase/thioredoxin
MFIVEDEVQAPEFTVTSWINSEPVALADLEGKVVLVDFWDYSNINCIRTLPYLKAWHERYSAKGLVIVGMHAPEFLFGKEAENVQRAVKTFGLPYSVGLDNAFETWRAYTNQHWPAKYLIDGKGLIRYFHYGEGEYIGTEYVIHELLHEINPDLILPDLMFPLRESDASGAVYYRPTPELYLGYERGYLANKEGYKPGEVITYEAPQQLGLDRIYLEGAWQNADAFVETVGAEAHAIHLIYRGAEMNLVMQSACENPITLILKQDGAPIPAENRGADVTVNAAGQTVVVVDQPRMYNLTLKQDNVIYRLGAEADEPGLQVFAFTFVSCLAPPEEQERVF